MPAENVVRVGFWGANISSQGVWKPTAYDVHTLGDGWFGETYFLEGKQT